MSYDLFVIGGGSGGVRAARMAAATGAKVGLAEAFRYGGTCVIRGCVPKKLFSYAAHGADDARLAKGYGWDISVGGFDWSHLIAAKDKEIDRLEGIYEKMLGGAGVDLFRGHASITAPGEVTVNGEAHAAKRILIATGGTPQMPDLPGAELGISSNEAFHLERLPERIAVYGAGYIAVEFAGIFNGLGVETHLIYRGDHILRGFDDDVRAFLSAEIQKKGIHLHLNTEIRLVSGGGDEKMLALSDGSSLSVGEVMFATGRIPNSTGLGLEAAGVETDRKGAIIVDEHFRTSADGIWALGDVINRVQLTPVALGEAMCFVDTEFKGTPRSMNYEAIPTAVFSDPQIGTVGLTEEQALEQSAEIEVFVADFRPMKYILPEKDERTLMKLIVDKASRKILGAHVCGVDAGEMMQGIGIAVRMGATKEDFDATVGIHPTSAEEFVTMRSVTRTVKGNG